jgi:hypothetical protein
MLQARWKQALRIHHNPPSFNGVRYGGAPAIPHRSYMELAGWHLIHRDDNDLLDLARQAELDGASAHVDQEPNGVNLFMHLRRSA